MEMLLDRYPGAHKLGKFANAWIHEWKAFKDPFNLDDAWFSSEKLGKQISREINYHWYFGRDHKTSFQPLQSLLPPPQPLEILDAEVNPEDAVEMVMPTNLSDNSAEEEDKLGELVEC